MDQAEDTKISPEQTAAVLRLADTAFEFGVDCASTLPPQTFDDPVMHSYYLFFVFGGLEWLGDHLEDEPHAYEAKLTAMAAALTRFDDTDKESIRGTVLMIHNAKDAPALRVRQAGREAAEAWLQGDREQAKLGFKALADDPGALPREVDPIAPTPTKH